MSAPSDPGFALQWGLQTIGAPAAWEQVEATSAVKVAVIDTGVDYRNKDLASHIDTENAYDILGKSRIAQDREGHGTWVAGIVGAQADDYGVVGVAPGVTILPVRVLGSEGTGDDVTVSDGIRWAADHDADIINLSLGSATCSDLLVKAIEYATGKGAIVVAAAGNAETDSFISEMGDPYPAVSYPAALPDVIAVGATTLNDTVAGFSITGPQVDIAAPGVSVVSDKLGGGVMGADGTSASSPMVAGAAALLLSDDPGLDAEAVLGRLRESAHDIGAPGDDVASGAGRLNIGKALDPSASEGGRPDGFERNESTGVTLPPSPVKGDVDTGLGMHDVFHVRLQAGQRFTASTTSPGDEPAGVSLFAPNVSSVFTDASLASTLDYYDAKIDFIALNTGDYVIDMSPGYFAGSGIPNPYTLTYKITTPAPSEYALPGVSLPASPVTRTVPLGAETAYYRVHLDANQRFGVKATSKSPVMGLYDADAWSIESLTSYLDGNGPTGEEPVAVSDNFGDAYYEDYFWGTPPTKDALSFVAEEEGDFLLAVMPSAFSSPFVKRSLTLDWRISDLTQPKDIPGEALRASLDETRGVDLASLDRAFDPDRVYSIDLKAGEGFAASLASSTTIDADLLVYSPGSQSVRASTPLTASMRSGGLEGVYFTAPIDGTYYVCVSAYRGAGGTTLSWNTGPGVVPELSARASTVAPAYGRSVTISVIATDTVSGQRAAGIPVAVEQLVWDEFWMPVGLAMTRTDGTATLSVKPSVAGKYRAVVRDLTEEYASATIAIKPGIYLSTPKTSTSSPRRNVTFTVSGTAKPRLPSGTRAVKIRVRRKVGSSWTSTRYIWATTRSNTYKASVKLTASGKWEIVAQFVGDSLSSASSSTAKYVTVR
ncbi:MAG: S8 family serine peptidase [Coriobacteriales bacterium]|nr:S8 family serine peptidase [Coriobacteriales bacterium]